MARRDSRHMTIYWTRSRVYFEAFRRRRLSFFVFRPNKMDQVISSIWSTSEGWWPDMARWDLLRGHLLSSQVMSPGHLWRDEWTALSGPLSLSLPPLSLVDSLSLCFSHSLYTLSLPLSLSPCAVPSGEDDQPTDPPYSADFKQVLSPPYRRISNRLRASPLPF